MVASRIDAFGERLKHAMENGPAGHVSVAAVAAQCKVSYQAVKKWQDYDTPKLEAQSAVRISELLGCHLLWLLTGKGPAWVNEVPQKEAGPPLRPAIMQRLASLHERDLGHVEHEILKVLKTIEDRNLELEADNRSLEQPGDDRQARARRNVA